MINVHSVALIAVLVGHAFSASATDHHHHGFIRGAGCDGELREEENDAKTTMAVSATIPI